MFKLVNKNPKKQKAGDNTNQRIAITTKNKTQGYLNVALEYKKNMR